MHVEEINVKQNIQHTHIPVLYLFAALPPDNEKGNSKLYDGLYIGRVYGSTNTGKNNNAIFCTHTHA